MRRNAHPLPTPLQTPHALYTRYGETFNIRHTARVPLVKALCGTVLNLKALDGAHSSRRSHHPQSHWAIPRAHASLSLIQLLSYPPFRSPGRTLSVPVPEIIPCGMSKTLAGAGLPRGDGTFGDLVVVFEHIFPKSVSDTQKTLLRAALFLPQTLNPQQAVRAALPSREFPTHATSSSPSAVHRIACAH